MQNNMSYCDYISISKPKWMIDFINANKIERIPGKYRKKNKNPEKKPNENQDKEEEELPYHNKFTYDKEMYMSSTRYASFVDKEIRTLQILEYLKSQDNK